MPIDDQVDVLAVGDEIPDDIFIGIGIFGGIDRVNKPESFVMMNLKRFGDDVISVLRRDVHGVKSRVLLAHIQKDSS